MAHALNNNTTIEIEEIEKNINEQFKFLLGIFPDADPRYLREVCDIYCNERKDINALQRFIRKTLKSKEYPRKTENEKEKDRESQLQFYTSHFNIENFLKNFPNPEDHFSEKNEKRINMIKNMSAEEKYYMEISLRNQFPLLYCKQIKAVLKENSYNLIKTVESLENCKVYLKKQRSQQHIHSDSIRIELIQEIAYFTNRRDILNYIESKKLKRTNDITMAKASNSLNTCQCCFDDEVLREETMICEIGHTFCLECTKKGCEAMLEQGKQEFPCLTNCDKYFNVFELETVLFPKVYASVCQARQLKEIKAAHVENLECCPHCDFAAIVETETRVFECLNPACRKETCRLCREPAHCPLRCDEVEKSEEIKIRTLFEDRMTDALVRTCYKCNMKFLKEDGCNKMKCPCGAKMCYVCKEPVSDYTHFNGEGGENYHLCPLFSNTDKLHERNVLEEATKLRQSNAGVNLKNDPTKNTETYYREKKEKKRRRCQSCGHCH